MHTGRDTVTFHTSELLHAHRRGWGEMHIVSRFFSAPHLLPPRRREGLHCVITRHSSPTNSHPLHQAWAITNHQPRGLADVWYWQARVPISYRKPGAEGMGGGGFEDPDYLLAVRLPSFSRTVKRNPPCGLRTIHILNTASGHTGSWKLF